MPSETKGNAKTRGETGIQEAVCVIDVAVARDGLGEGRSHENFAPPHEIFPQSFRCVSRGERALMKGAHHLFEVCKVCPALWNDVASVQ